MLYFIQNTVLSPEFSFNVLVLSLRVGSVWGSGIFQYNGVFSVPVGQHVSSMSFPLSLSLNPGVPLSVFMDERCEVFVLKNNKRIRGRVRSRGVEEGCTRAAASSPLLSCYSSSSRCFLPRTGPWPFLREPFWGRRRCPRSCSVHGTPPCPSSLSRSESECMRAEEVGAGTGFIRAGRWVVVQEHREDKTRSICYLHR